MHRRRDPLVPGRRGVPLVIHNAGPKPSEDDRLDTWTVLGHFRPK